MSLHHLLPSIRHIPLEYLNVRFEYLEYIHFLYSTSYVEGKTAWRTSFSL